MGKVQAKDTVISEEAVYIGRKGTGLIEFATSVFSDDLSNPVQEALKISFDVVPIRMPLTKLLGRKINLVLSAESND